MNTSNANMGAAEDPYNTGWVKSETAARNPEYESSTGTSATVGSSGASYPEHSSFYAEQPGQLSEAEEIAKKKAEAEENQGKKGIGGAAAVAGIAGLFFVGPIVGVAAAGGAAYVAATNKGAAGSVVRASGTAASAVGTSARNFDKKHQVVAKTGRGIATGVGWVAGKFNRKNRRSSANPQAAAADLTN